MSYLKSIFICTALSCISNNLYASESETMSEITPSKTTGLFKEIKRSLKKSPRAKKIAIKEQITDTLDAHIMTKALKKSQIETVEIFTNKIDSETLNLLVSRLLIDDTSVQCLTLIASNFVGGAPSTETCPIGILLRNFALSDREFASFEPILLSLPFSVIDLSNNNLTDKGIACLSRILKHKKVRSINLSGNKIGDLGIDLIAEMIKRKSLKNLQLYNTALTKMQIEKLAAAVLTRGKKTKFRLDVDNAFQYLRAFKLCEYNSEKNTSSPRSTYTEDVDCDRFN